MPDQDQFWLLDRGGLKLSPWPDFIPLDPSDSDSNNDGDNSSDARTSSPSLTSTSISRDFHRNGRAKLRVDGSKHKTMENATPDDGVDYGENGRSGHDENGQ
ncbi:uncharacterized protein B0H64DRAFT_111304 [Chaetomium fimeti]|uniref:Uncharacterized protein n=1 Tax=Chaetomium fimeti TaxID=1854472 RepID=A0AAE0LU38_9PEZI|nr:hypothetical protein B0H64DRAFT_111304 [Chaetomium fimeti]